MNNRIRIAIVGIGNCASSLVQGIHYYRDSTPESAIGLMHHDIGGYRPEDIDVVAAFDIDKRKVGHDVSHAIFAEPNCTTRFMPDIAESGVKVQMGAILDGCSAHMDSYPDDERFLTANQKEPSKGDIVKALEDAKVDMVVNYLPVGSERAARFYAECALMARCAFINNIPVFIASDPSWAKRFQEAGLPLIGDDIKAQLGATITHRVLADLFAKRGVTIDRTYQLNTGGNTDFLNMLNRQRLTSKKTSKTEAVQSSLLTRLIDKDIHVGPSDYVPWQKDNKVCYIRIEGRLFGEVPMNLELRLSVEDSPNSAGVAIDGIRCAKLALDRGLSGVIDPVSQYFCKHPPRQTTDDIAHQNLEDYIKGLS